MQDSTFMGLRYSAAILRYLRAVAGASNCPYCIITADTFPGSCHIKVAESDDEVEFCEMLRIASQAQLHHSTGHASKGKWLQDQHTPGTRHPNGPDEVEPSGGPGSGSNGHRLERLEKSLREKEEAIRELRGNLAGRERELQRLRQELETSEQDRDDYLCALTEQAILQLPQSADAASSQVAGAVEASEEATASPSPAEQALSGQDGVPGGGEAEREPLEVGPTLEATQEHNDTEASGSAQERTPMPRAAWPPVPAPPTNAEAAGPTTEVPETAADVTDDFAQSLLHGGSFEKARSRGIGRWQMPRTARRAVTMSAGKWLLIAVPPALASLRKSSLVVWWRSPFAAPCLRTPRISKLRAMGLQTFSMRSRPSTRKSRLQALRKPWPTKASKMLTLSFLPGCRRGTCSHCAWLVTRGGGPRHLGCRPFAVQAEVRTCCGDSKAPGWERLSSGRFTGSLVCIM